MDPENLRTDYTRGSLVEQDLLPSPCAQLQRWLDEAERAGALEPNAMTLATATRDGRPSARIVLLRGLAEDGLRFFSNYESRKGDEIGENPHAALQFFWPLLERQVRVEGTVSRLSKTDSERYFHSRPRESQIGAWASKQSKPLQERALLEESVRARTAEFGDGPIELPPFWGGYLLSPSRFEFWQGRKSRLHDRLVYQKSAHGFSIERLYP
jgi:pyridoxamine 5'-phosphate oxidase